MSMRLAGAAFCLGVILVLICSCDPTVGVHKFVSRVKNNLEGGPAKEISFETHVLAEDETRIVRPKERVVALVSNTQTNAILLLGLDGGVPYVGDGSIHLTTAKGLRGWLLLNNGNPGGVGSLYDSGIPTPPPGFREGISQKNPDGSFSYLNRSRLWAEWWRVANSGQQGKYGVDVFPVEGSLTLDMKDAKWTRLLIDVTVHLKDGRKVAYSGTVSWEKVKELKY